MIIKESLRHLNENNMTYCQHLLFASAHGLRCMKAGICLVLHSLIPAILPKTGSNLVNELNKSFIDHNEYLKCKKEQTNV
jgi:hypothetical protein